MSKPIRVNYRNIDGVRSSTTINWNIGFHYWMVTNKDVVGLPEDYIELTRKAVQDYVNDLEHQIGKDCIEMNLLFRIASQAALNDSLERNKNRGLSRRS